MRTPQPRSVTAQGPLDSGVCKDSAKAKEVTMGSVDDSTKTDAAPEVKPVDMKLEVVVIGVSDVDRAKAFYENLGWRLDGDFTVGDDFRAVQMTPHNSQPRSSSARELRPPSPAQ